MLRLPPEQAERYLLRSGDVLMTEGGDPDKLGRGCVWENSISPCLHQNHVFAVRPHQNRLMPRYLAAVLSSGYGRAYFQQTSKQTTNLASTNQNTIGSFRIPLPSLAEQAIILSQLEEELSPKERSIHQAERKIDLIREYQTRITSDVVTGQLDVRVADRLPIDIEESQPEPDEDELLEEVFEDA